MVGLFDSRKSVENGVVIDAITHKVIDGEVANSHTGEILEEVSALAGIHPEIAQTCFYNDFSC